MIIKKFFSLIIKRRWTVFSLFIIVTFGFYTKFYSGPVANWVGNSLSGVFYEIFWCLLIFLFLINLKPGKIAASVLLITCLLEFLQLYHHPFLEYMRDFFIGRTLLGNYFSWSDFPYYFLGCAIGWYWIKWLKRKEVWWIKCPHNEKKTPT